MGNIKKKINGLWNVVASGNATGISVTNPSLLEEGESVDSVDGVLSRHQSLIEKLLHNVSWLAKHGGGGSGGGGGDSGATEATCKITVNGAESGTNLLVDSNGLTVKLTELDIKFTKSWNVSILIGSVSVVSTALSFTNPSIIIPLSKISSYLSNHIGKLTISASYEDETSGIYGASSWQADITESVVNLSLPNYSVNLNTITTSQLIYNYSVGIVGNYNLIIDIVKNNTKIKSETQTISINNTQEQAKSIQVSDLLDVTQAETLMGVYNITSTLQYVDNPLVYTTVTSTLTIVSDTILIASNTMSESQSSPVEVSLSSSINLAFTAYLQNANSYIYTCTINDTTVKSESIGYFGTAINEYIPVDEKWAKEDTVYPLVLTVASGSQKASKTFYIKVVAAKDSFLTMSTSAQEHLMTEFLARNYETGIDSFELISSAYTQGGVTNSVTTTLTSQNPNNLSTIKRVTNTGLPYMRYSNGCYGVMGPWVFNSVSKGLNDFISVTNNFTISICFKADYHPDDNRTILFSGTTDNSSGKIQSGISIDVHSVYIDNTEVLQLTDNTINMVDIVCSTRTRNYTDADGNQHSDVTYIVKVYLDGVMSSVTNLVKRPVFGTNLYLGARIVNDQADYLCDFNLYNLQIYDKALSDFDVMVNYINNKVSTNYENMQPSYSLIDNELKTNFCERNADGSVKSLMFNVDSNSYDISFLLSNNILSEENLNAHAKVLGLPVMLIDVSTDSNWTFNNFVTQQTVGQVTLSDTTNRTIYYWDPNGNDTHVKKLENVTIGLQGHSTLKDSVKNLNITVPDSTVFIPTETWFPEQTYTLKADVVDSSHSTNAAIGKFINTVLGYHKDGSTYYPFDEVAIDNVETSNYKKTQQPTATLKHTVEGFPILLIMHFNTQNSGDVAITPLGIYSFNLGRDAYRNLGFKKVNSIQNSMGDTPEIKTFPYLIEGAVFNETDSDANWIEINDTYSIADMSKVSTSIPDDFDSSHGDFWQNADSILDKQYDVCYPSGKKASDYASFKSFVTNVMALPIEPCISTDSTGEVYNTFIKGSYPLYEYVTENNQSYYKKTDKTNTMIDNDSALGDLGFNTDSAYKYFVICFLFGLIDNFGKNSTYRSWKHDTKQGDYFVDFYDLDCALGNGNQGLVDVEPDLWLKYLYNRIIDGKDYGYVCETFKNSNEETDETIKNIRSQSVVAANHSKLWLSLDTAVLKSKISVDTKQSMYTYHWFALRNYLDSIVEAAGYTDFADYFIDEHFSKQTKNCGPLLFNYDYKLKYLVQFTTSDIESTKDLSKLHGRKIALARNWLKKHIAFLDSLFAWRDKNQTLNFKNDNDSFGSNTVVFTPDSLPIQTNTPIIIRNGVGGEVDTCYFVPANTKMYLNVANKTSNSQFTWTISNAPYITQLGDLTTPLANMSIQVLSKATNKNALNTQGYPAITELLLSGNSHFDSTFNLDAFAEGVISELRTIDLSNTSGKSFALNLVKNPDTDAEYTIFTKLTSIDISNSSCISSVTIPEVPLKNLKVANSSIQIFKLKNQHYLSDVDLTGCNFLNTIILQNCSAYKKLQINALPNITSISIAQCKSIESIEITNCSTLKSVDIEYCDNLKSIVITGNSGLTGTISGTNFVTIKECKNLQTLDLSDNTNLAQVTVEYSRATDKANLVTLKLHNTHITSFALDNTTDLDLSEFTGLVSPTFYHITELTSIQFTNNKDNPIPLTESFQGCTNLTRIYGCVELSASASGTHEDDDGKWRSHDGMFHGCKKFSLHGTGVPTWKGLSTQKDKIWQTPWELLQDDPDKFGNISLSDTFQEGSKVTNIRFSKANQLRGTLQGTACTQFDVYYFLCILALSDLSGQEGYYTFSGNNLFDWSTGNQPSRYTFYKCNCITQLSYMFQTGKPTYVCSPTVVDGVVTKDDGVLSPLINVVHFEHCFYNSFVCDKYLLRRKKDPYAITYFNEPIQRVYDTQALVEGETTLTDKYLKEHLGNSGNLNDFFQDCTNLTQLNGFTVKDYVNFDNLILPTSVTHLDDDSFNCTYGSGTLDFEKLFPEGSNIRFIKQCFNISNKDWGIVQFPISNTTFKNTIHLEVYGSREKELLSGDGIHKYLKDDVFPYNIVSHLTELTGFCRFFEDVEGNLASPALVPGSMFENCAKLTTINHLFCNANFEKQLTSEGFKNCPKLQDVAYAFALAEASYLTGSIPYRLFYLGENSSPTTLTIQGVDDDEKPDSSYDLSKLQTVTIEIPSVIKSITDMSGCFQGCANLEHYTKPTNWEDYVENNAYYAPYKWIYDSNTKTWSEGEITQIKDMSWIMDGTDTTDTSEYYRLDLNKTKASAYNFGKPDDLNYICAPDLFRYCANSRGTLISYAFSACGTNGTATSGNDSCTSYGLAGRIPPQLLRPLSNIQSIEGLFMLCGRFASYTNTNGEIYQIPEDFFNYTPKLTNLTLTFAGMTFQAYTNLNVFSNKFSSSTDIRGIFSSCVWDHKALGNWQINNVFSNCNLSAISGAFSLEAVTLTEYITGVSPTAQRQAGTKGGTTSISSIFTANKIPDSSRIYYVFYNWKDKATDSNIKSEHNNYE